MNNRIPSYINNDITTNITLRNYNLTNIQSYVFNRFKLRVVTPTNFLTNTGENAYTNVSKFNAKMCLSNLSPLKSPPSSTDFTFICENTAQLNLEEQIDIMFNRCNADELTTWFFSKHNFTKQCLPIEEALNNKNYILAKYLFSLLKDYHLTIPMKNIVPNEITRRTSLIMEVIIPSVIVTTETSTIREMLLSLGENLSANLLVVALQEAIKLNNPEILSTIFTCIADKKHLLEKLTSPQNSLLHNIILQGSSIEITSILLDKGFKLNFKHEIQKIIFYCLQNNSLAILNLLLKHGTISLSDLNTYYKTSEHIVINMAEYQNNISIYRVFMLPLEYVVANNNLDTLLWIISRGVLASTSDNYKNNNYYVESCSYYSTPLHRAVLLNDQAKVSLLLVAGAKRNAVAFNQHIDKLTALEYAKSLHNNGENREHIIKLLEEPVSLLALTIWKLVMGALETGEFALLRKRMLTNIMLLTYGNGILANLLYENPNVDTTSDSVIFNSLSQTEEQNYNTYRD